MRAYQEHDDVITILNKIIRILIINTQLLSVFLNYFFFSQKLKAENIESALRKAQRQLKEAQDIENANSKGKALPKRFRVNNVLVNATIEYQTKLRDLSKKRLNLSKRQQLQDEKDFFASHQVKI